jgi:hypothetical protein
MGFGRKRERRIKGRERERKKEPYEDHGDLGCLPFPNA